MHLFIVPSFVSNTFFHESFIQSIRALVMPLHHSLFLVFLLSLRELHTSLALPTSAYFNCYQICSTLLTSSHSTILLSSPLVYSSLYCCSYNFSLLILPALFTSSLLFIHVPCSRTLHCTKV